MDLEGIMLSEISQRKINIIWYLLHMALKTKKAHRYREKIEDGQRQGWGRHEYRVSEGVEKKKDKESTSPIIESGIVFYLMYPTEYRKSKCFCLCSLGTQPWNWSLKGSYLAYTGRWEASGEELVLLSSQSPTCWLTTCSNCEQGPVRSSSPDSDA